jgi:plastocyanin
VCVCVITQALRSTPASASTVTGTVEISQRAKSHEGLSDIVVWLKPVLQNATSSIAPEHVQLLQKNKMFHPHVLPITVGSIVDFPNADPIFHNAFSSFDGQIFDLGLYAPGTSKSIHFHEPGVVRVFCNIHPTMSAVILVLDTPYFARVGRDGRYRIPKVPPGSYELRVFDERATAGPDVQMMVKVDSTDEQTAAPPVHLSELGYVRLPHKNKYGLDYPASSSDLEIYPGPAQ